MDRKLATLTLLTYSLTNLCTFCAVTYERLRGGCIILLLLGIGLIMLLGFLNYVKLVKEDLYNLNNYLIGFAPSCFFGACYLVGVISGIYLGWRA